jgi:hypothetical protein
MLIPLLMLAATSGITPADVRKLLAPQDYPDWAIKRNESAAAYIDALIEPTGLVSRCDTLQTMGPADLARQVCRTVKGRHVGPARDAAGTAVYGFFRGTLSFFLPETKEGRSIAAAKSPPDAVLTVANLRAGQQEVEAQISLLVDEKGNVVQCAADPQERQQDVVDAVCSATGLLGVRPVLDLQGNPVRVVRTMKVRLTTKTAPPSPGNSAERRR